MAANFYKTGKGIVSRRITPLWGFLALALLAFVTAVPVAVMAANTPPSTCEQYAGLLYRLSGCMRDSINATASIFFSQFSTKLADAIGAFFTLAVIVYGIMLAWGLVEKVGRDTMVLLIKLSAVLYFVSNSQMMFDTITEAMDTAAYAVVKYTPPSSLVLDASGTTLTQTTCVQGMFDKMASNPEKIAITPWLGVDCLLDTVIGIKKVRENEPPPVFDGSWFNPKFDNPDPTKTNPGMARGMVFFFTSGMQTSVMGVVMAVAGFVFIFGLVMLIIRSFMIYVMGYIGLAFMIAISPLIIPLILMPQTKQYFDKWVKLLFSFSLQPVLSLVFVIFMLTALDLAAFSGSYSMVYRISGDASRSANFDLNGYLTAWRNPDTGAKDPNQEENKHDPKSKQIISREDVAFIQVKADNASGPTEQFKDQGGTHPNQANSVCTKSLIKEYPELKKMCDTVYNIGARMDKVNWLLMAKARTPAVKMPDGSTPPDDAALQKQISNEVISSVIFACLVVFVLNGLTKLVPTMLIDVLGDVGQTPDLFTAASGMGGGIGGLSGKLSDFAKTAKKKITGN